MPNIASILREEILRLARKEVRNELESLKKASARYRSELSELKRRLAMLEKHQSRVERKLAGKPETPEPGEPAKGLRFSAKRFASQRQKLGLSAAQMGTLINVSAQTIYYWEAGKTRPRQAQLTALAALRGIGKRQVKARLEQLANQGTEVS